MIMKYVFIVFILLFVVAFVYDIIEIIPIFILSCLVLLYLLGLFLNAKEDRRQMKIVKYKNECKKKLANARSETLQFLEQETIKKNEKQAEQQHEGACVNVTEDEYLSLTIDNVENVIGTRWFIKCISFNNDGKPIVIGEFFIEFYLNGILKIDDMECAYWGFKDNRITIATGKVTYIGEMINFRFPPRLSTFSGQAFGSNNSRWLFYGGAIDSLLLSTSCRNSQNKQDIIGTKWLLSYTSIEKINIIEFHNYSIVKFENNEEKWEIKNDEIIISSNNNGITWIGRITDGIFSGIAIIFGESHFFKGVPYSEKPTKITRDNKQNFENLDDSLKKKSNWQEFQSFLQQNRITTLYHFTDKANISSIKERGGLYSWYYCDRNKITIPFAGGNELSRHLDTAQDLADYVRLSFCKEHPMKFIAKQEGRIKDPVILEIKLDVVYFKETRFANMNATKNEHCQGLKLENLKAIHFDIIKQPNYNNLKEVDKPYYQAEVLVKTCVPIEYITNINNF